MAFDTNKYILRQADIHDVNSIHAVISEGALRGQILIRSEDDIKSVITSQVSQFFVVTENDRIIACCSVEIYNKKLAELRSLAVLSSYLKQGLGSALIKKCVAYATNQNVYEVLTITDKISLFGKFGFLNKLREQSPLFLKLRNVNG